MTEEVLLNFPNIKKEVEAEFSGTKNSLLSYCNQNGQKDTLSSNFIECNYHETDSATSDQGLEDKDPLSTEDVAGQNFKDSVLANAPNSFLTDEVSGIKTEFDEALQQSEQSVVTRPSIDDIKHCQPICNNQAPHEELASETRFAGQPNFDMLFIPPNDKKLNVCDICQKKFSNKFNLTRHMKIHNGEYECSICQMIWFCKSDLNRHMVIHNGQKLYECDICEKKFSQQQNLTYHMRTHIGNQPYECHICKKTYTFKCHLTLHMKFHNGEKPYECKICNNNFTQRSDLTKHMRIHCEEKQYECVRCAKRFAQKSNLIRHMRQHQAT